MSSQPIYWPHTLVTWATSLFEARGTDLEKAASIASILVEGDLLGHDTHGLALLGPYLRKIDEGILKPTGTYDVVSDRPAAMLWDGGGLPGPWLTAEAVTQSGNRAKELGTATITIRRSGHIACLAAYLEAPAREGLIIEIFSSDPSVASVAPFGGTRAAFTPNPVAIAIPTSGDPILIDISTSITTNGMSARLQSQGKRFPGNWLLDASGRPTDDPAVFDADPPGTIQLLGGRDAGHKGYGLTLLVEAMTGGLAAYGRAENPTDWGATVMVRATDPEAFGGLTGFNHELDWLANACRGNPAIDASSPVRLPGERGLALKRDALEHGLVLNPAVQTDIAQLASETSIALPQSI
ncbi:MAG: LDH2 family malate/lactate/ureidoglycolate dehydrogenase [Alphaproteobacteria bacterium]|jgi:LDH2 family malate/lactate/ureidoglycolate dehydrogenase